MNPGQLSSMGMEIRQRFFVHYLPVEPFHNHLIHFIPVFQDPVITPFKQDQPEGDMVLKQFFRKISCHITILAREGLYRNQQNQNCDTSSFRVAYSFMLCRRLLLSIILPLSIRCSIFSRLSRSSRGLPVKTSRLA